MYSKTKLKGTHTYTTFFLYGALYCATTWCELETRFARIIIVITSPQTNNNNNNYQKPRAMPVELSVYGGCQLLRRLCCTADVEVFTYFQTPSKRIPMFYVLANILLRTWRTAVVQTFTNPH